MRVIHGSRAAKNLPPQAVAIGIFDGVHRGHQALLQRAIDCARRDGMEALAYTFHPHPAALLAPEFAPLLIEPVARRLERLESLGLDGVLLEPFEHGFAQIEARSFVEDILVATLACRHVIVGDGFTFGHAQRGNVALLQALADKHGFTLHVIPPVRIDGLTISSTKIREFVRDGRVQSAAVLLGRPYEMQGQVVRGVGRGATIGVPTANVDADNALMPAVGVYAGYADGAISRHATVINVGYSPTFGGGKLRIEAHFLDYAGGDLYGVRLRLHFVERLRDEQKFSGVETLTAQIHADIEHARRLLAPGT